MTMNITPKLNDLWGRLMDLPFETKEATLVLDIRTRHDATKEDYRGDFDLMFGTWRGIEIEVVATMPDASIARAADTIPDEPFCAYIRYRKPNGRVCYIDDPETNEVFL